MKRRFRSPSLFWTFAGAFLAVLIVAALLQGLVLVLVIEPLATRWVEDRADMLAQHAAHEIAVRLSESPDANIRTILRTYREEAAPMVLVFRQDDSLLITDRRMPPPSQRRFRDFLRGESDTLRPDRRRPGENRGAARRQPVSRHQVVVDSSVVGEVIAWAPRPRFGVLPATVPRPLLLSLPLAVIVAGAAGLIMFRILLRRLRALENLAARVTEGDLDARVPDPGLDEIGQLATRLNRMTESLAEARRHLDESDRQRRQLLADISHELATPLTSIRGYTETLLEPEVPVSEDERAAYLRDILEESKRMDLLIQDLLDLTRLEAEAADLENVRLDWTALSRNTMNRFQTRFREARLTLRWSGPGEPAWVSADGRRLEQVLENLLMNALRYVPQGGTVTLSLAPADKTSPDCFRLTISDDGLGFPAEDLPHVFDRFYRADAARSTGGTGLGLAIVKEIIRRHGGEVRAENREPAGAAIMIDLPRLPE